MLDVVSATQEPGHNNYSKDWEFAGHCQKMQAYTGQGMI